MTRSPPTKGGVLSDGVRRYVSRVVELTYLMAIQVGVTILSWVNTKFHLVEENKIKNIYRGYLLNVNWCKIEIYFTSDHRKQYFHEWRSHE